MLGPALVQPERHQPDVVLTGAFPGHRFHAVGFFLHDADPRQLESPGPDGDAAGFAEQLLAIANAHDGRVDPAQHGVDAVQPGDMPLLFLAREELPGLAADHLHRAQQALVGLAAPPGGEGDDADRPALRRHRQCERAPYPALARQVRLPYAGIVERIGGPQRLSRLPDKAHKPGARSERHLARALDEFLERGLGHAPGFLETQQPRLFVHAEIPAEVPALRFADRAHDRLQPLRGIVGVGDLPDHRVLQRKELLAAFALGARGRFAHRALDHGRQAHEVGLEYVVARAVLERANGIVLAERAGDENERYLRSGLANDVGPEFAELAPEIRLALDPARVHDKAGALELARCKEGVVLDVLNQQNSESLSHFRPAKRSRRAGLLRAFPSDSLADHRRTTEEGQAPSGLISGFSPFM